MLKFIIIVIIIIIIMGTYKIKWTWLYSKLVSFKF